MKSFMICSLMVVISLVFVGTSNAAMFEFYDGGFHTQGEAYSQNSSDEIHEPGIVSNWDEMASNVEPWAQVGTPPDNDFVYTTGSSCGVIDEGPGTDIIKVRTNCYVDYQSDDPGGYGHVYANANTVESGITKGVFFRIAPEDGESLGDPVTVNFLWNAQMQSLCAVGSARTRIGGGDTDNLGITLNDYPASDPISWIWTHSEETIDGSNDCYDEQHEDFFHANIGDVIGIHLGTGADLAADGLDGNFCFAFAYQTIDMQVTSNPVPIPGAVWLLGSGLVGLVGIVRARKKH